MKKIWLLILIAFFLWPFQTEAFTISPTRTVLTIEPGDTSRLSIDIKNDSSEPKTYQLGTLTFLENTQGQIYFETQSSEPEGWVKTAEEKIVLNPKESRRVSYVVKIPEEVPAGSYYLALGVKELSDEGGQVGLSGQVASLLTLQVAGEVEEKMVLKEVKTLQTIYFNQPWRSEISLKNLSPVEVPVKGRVFLKDPFGELVAFEDLPLGRDLLAGSERRIQTVLWENESLVWPGIYRLYFGIDYGKTNARVEQEINVWYLPKWFLIGTPALLVLIIILSILKKKSYKRNA